MSPKVVSNSPAETDRAVVLYDGQCAFCRKSVEILRRLDWRDRLLFRNARDRSDWPRDLPPLSEDRLVEEMHLVTPGRDRVFHGFGAFRWMAWRLPLLWFAAPLLYIPGIPQLGQRLYLWIARRRFHLVPCHDGVCSLPAPPPSSR
jgi:predicted DCC family thiol-disulfide oxidoreductase YuxK